MHIREQNCGRATFNLGRVWKHKHAQLTQQFHSLIICIEVTHMFWRFDFRFLSIVEL